MLLNTTMPLDFALFRFLSMRAAAGEEEVAVSFLFPLFLLALGALAVPVLIHLTQRERKAVVEFPSLMFLRKIPYESVQRRRIRDALLLMLRLAALALIVAAFARPFLRGSELAAAPGGARDIVVLLDRSYSMGYGDTWARAQRAAAAAIESATPADRISLVLFADVAEVALRSTPDRGRAVGEINAATPGPGSTKFGPALKLAGSLLAESLLPRKEVIVVSDFQRGGWLPDDTLRMPGGTLITPVAVEPGQGLNLAVTPVALLRTREAGNERVTVTAGVLNRSATAATSVPIHLEVDGRPVQDQTISAAPNASASVTFAPLSITNANTRVSVRLGTAGQAPVDALERDNVFHFVVTPAAPVPVMVVSQGRADANLYLSRALAIGEAPRFDSSMQSPEALAGDAMNRARLIILNDVPVGDAAAAKLVTFVEGGGGLLIAAGQRASWPPSRSGWLPASIGPPVDRTRGTPARLSGMDYGHAVFEPFRAPRSGDFSTTRFYSYRGAWRGEGRHRAGALRHRRAGARRAQRGTRQGRGVCLHPRSHVERSRAEADVPAVRPSAWPPSVGVQGATGVAEHRPGAGRRCRRSGGRRHVRRAGARGGGTDGADADRTAPRSCRRRGPSTAGQTRRRAMRRRPRRHWSSPSRVSMKSAARDERRDR